MDRMGAWRPALHPAHVQQRRVHVDLVPAQIAELGRAQPMAVGDQNHGGVAVTPPVPLGRLDFSGICACRNLHCWRSLIEDKPQGFCVDD
jgi:hypothetical protein